MSNGFENAPDMGNDFTESAYESPLEYDAADWEPMDDSYEEEPSEKHLEMHHTPGGTLEYEVHQELDQAARARILEAQNEQQSQHHLPDEQELDLSANFNEARHNAWGWDPDSQKEYESLSDEWNSQFDNEVFETGNRFERGSDLEQGEIER